METCRITIISGKTLKNTWTILFVRHRVLYIIIMTSCLANDCRWWLRRDSEVSVLVAILLLLWRLVFRHRVALRGRRRNRSSSGIIMIIICIWTPLCEYDYFWLVRIAGHVYLSRSRRKLCFKIESCQNNSEVFATPWFFDHWTNYLRYIL